MHPYTTFIIAAGGNSARMGMDKLSEPLYKNLPVAAFSLLAAQKATCVDEIIITTKSEKILTFRELARSLSITKLAGIVQGGNSRQQSVLEAVKAANPESKFYAIHDAARPFVTPTFIDQICQDAYTYGCAIPGIPVADTMKTMNEGFVGRTVPRSELIAVQTPQIFDAALYQRALSVITGTGQDFTDDCQMLEYIGARIFISEGSELNFKLTGPKDMVLARLMAEQYANEVLV